MDNKLNNEIINNEVLGEEARKLTEEEVSKVTGGVRGGILQDEKMIQSGETDKGLGAAQDSKFTPTRGYYKFSSTKR